MVAISSDFLLPTLIVPPANEFSVYNPDELPTMIYLSAK